MRRRLALWLFEAALLTVPTDWRDSVRQDLDEEASNGQDHLGSPWHAIVIGLTLRRQAARTRRSSQVRWWELAIGHISSQVVAVRHAWRSLIRAPWFALGATATFALGIGINVAVFASIDRLLFRPLPYRDPDRLFLMQQTDLGSGQRVSFLPAKYVAEARAQLDMIEDMAVLGDSTGGYFQTPAVEGLEIRVSMVTSRMLDLCGVRPVLGRGFVEEDDRLERKVVILTHEGWQARFGGDPNAVGRRLWTRDSSLEVIGILPPGYIPPGGYIDPDISGVALMPLPTIFGSAVSRSLPPTVRLRPGVSRETAQVALDALIERLKPAMPATPGGAQAIQLIPIRDAMFGQYYKYLWLVIGGAVLVLFIACANLAGLFLVRGRSRLRNAAVHLSLGASRTRLIGDAMAEGLIVCLAGAVAALLMLLWSARGLEATLPPIFGRFSAGVDTRVVIFALATAVATSFVASILPALLLGRDDVWRVMQGGSGPLGSGSPRRGRWLLTLETAVGVMLVAGAAVTARNLSGLTGAKLGFDPRDLQQVLIRSKPALPADRLADLQQALALVRGEPAVVSAAGAPMISVLRTAAAFSPSGPPCCRWEITGDYIQTIGIPILAGRAITDGDVRSHAPIALLSEAALHRLWPGLAAGAAIGRTISFDGEPTRDVVGIVGDTRRTLRCRSAAVDLRPLNKRQVRRHAHRGPNATRLRAAIRPARE